MIELEPTTLHLIVGSLIPILYGFIMRASWSSAIKANVGLVLSLVSAWLVNLINENGVEVITWRMLGLAVAQWAVAVAVYNGFYKPVVHPNETFPNIVPQLTKD